MVITIDNIYNDLQKQAYTQVDFPIDRQVLEEAIQAFFEFLKEPEEVKNHIDFTIAPNHRREDVGFKHRDPDDGIYNYSKDFFHYHPVIFNKYG
jgi:hypothetical protein